MEDVRNEERKEMKGGGEVMGKVEEHVRVVERKEMQARLLSLRVGDR